MVEQDKRKRPKSYIDNAIDLLNKNKKIKRYDIDILEVGSMRGPLDHHVDIVHYPCCNDGHSTYIFARTGWKVVTIDIDKNNIDIAKKACERFSNVEYYVADALEIIRSFVKKGTKIGLLFLDAWDVGSPGYAENHLKLYNLIKDDLNKDCMILIDDTDVYYDYELQEFFIDKSGVSGKGKLIIPELENNGYQMAFNGRQTLMVGL
jgi:SAM-dependent methyltransferase